MTTVFTITIVGGNNQSTIINTMFPSQLVVRVTHNSTISRSTSIRFLGPLIGPSATFSGLNPYVTPPQIIPPGPEGVIFTSGPVVANGIVGGPYIVEVQAIDGATVFPNITQFNLTNLPVCIAYGSRILMANGSLKPIQDINKGDEVAADKSSSKIFKVAKVNELQVEGSATDLVVFEKNSLGPGCPINKLITTGSHTIFINGMKRPAKSFSKRKGVTRYFQGKSNKHPLSDKEYSYQDLIDQKAPFILYDLQFDTPGSYVVEGIQVKSRDPRSKITPLEKEVHIECRVNND